MNASRLGSTKTLAGEPLQGGVDVAGALLGIGLGRPVAAADIGEAARREAVDDQGDVAPVAQKPGHARGVLPRTAAAVKDRDRGEAAVARRTEELRGKIELGAGVVDAHAHVLLRQRRRAAQQREKKRQTDDHAAHANEPSFSRSEHTGSFDGTKLYPSY